ncbi:hypothetical protein DPMN_018252, partial [Dreissena polymorpha]
EEVESPEVHFEPLVQLKPVEVITMEEEEEELIQMRAKLFRYDNSLDPPEWKERGTGTAKMLRHKKSNLVRVLMRRDKTHKLCANHYVQPEMELKPNCGSDKAWVWTTQADFSEDESRPELLAIRFANAENAQKWKQVFTDAQDIMKEAIPKHNEQVCKAPGSQPFQKATEVSKKEEVSTSGSGDVTTSAKTDCIKEDAEKVADKLESLTVKDSEKKAETDTVKTQDNKTDDEKCISVEKA